jgi:hypothetical protein
MPPQPLVQAGKRCARHAARIKADDETRPMPRDGDEAGMLDQECGGVSAQPCVPERGAKRWTIYDPAIASIVEDQRRHSPKSFVTMVPNSPRP